MKPKGNVVITEELKKETFNIILTREEMSLLYKLLCAELYYKTEKQEYFKDLYTKLSSESYFYL